VILSDEDVPVERALEDLSPDPVAFSQHVQLVRAYVDSQPGARRALMAAALTDPEGMTSSIVALGAVLLDVAAQAHDLAPLEMLDRLSDVMAEVFGAGEA
jgi:hypothetical protein